MGLVCDRLVIARGRFRLAADWSLPSGARLALTGPSGAGKSAFLSALAGFEDVTGRISLDGADLTRLAPAARPVTLMFQDHNLFPHLDVARNLSLGLGQVRPDMAARGRIAEALAAVGLAGFETRLPASLSGGQASRVALARALLRARPLLALDEPFAALGPGLRREMLALVGQIVAEQSATLIFVTHQPEDLRAATHIGFVDGGVVSAPVETETFLADPPAGARDYF